MRVPVALTGRRLDGYLAALTRAGASVIVPAITDDPGAVLDEVGALVLGGGPDVDPARYGQDPHPETYGADDATDRFDIALLEGALDRGLPVLAICRGLQVLNVAFGGSLHQHIPEAPGVEPHGRPGPGGHALAQRVAVEPDSLLAATFGATEVRASCHHHQSVARVGAGLRVVARGADGIVEGLEAADAWILAVQWHPEDTAPTDRQQQALFDAVVARARV